MGPIQKTLTGVHLQYYAVKALLVHKVSKFTCSSYYLQRFEVGHALSTLAGVPLGDVLVYNVQVMNISGSDCLTASIWITGVNGILYKFKYMYIIWLA